MQRDEFRVVLGKALDRVLTTKFDNPIGDDETFSDYGLDSLDQMNMLLEIEIELDTELGEVDLKQYDTPAKLNDYINTQSTK